MKIIRENAFEHKKKKPGLILILGLTLQMYTWIIIIQWRECLHVLLLICYTALKIQLMFCGNFHTNICQLLNTKFSLLIYLHLPWKCAFGTQSRVCWCQLLLREILTQKWLDVNLNYSIILAQMWPNLARTGLQKYAACRQWSLSCYCSAKMIA